MDTVQEALFKAMLNDGWFTESDGNVESPQGYFGYVHNHHSEWFEVSQMFCETITAYAPELELGHEPPEWFAGVFWATINSQGIIAIEKLGDVNERVTNTFSFANSIHRKAAKKRYDETVTEFGKWNSQGEE